MGFDELAVFAFRNIEIGKKFATVANNKIVVWIKLENRVSLYAGDTDDGYTSFVINAVTINGFGAVFSSVCPVVKVDEN